VQVRRVGVVVHHSEETPKWPRNKRRANRAVRRAAKQLVLHDGPDGTRLADLRLEVLRKWEPLAR
jgi:hypothetical protein